MKYALTETVENILGHPVPERNQNAVVRCPFHQDRLPSLSIDLERGLWICFGCGLRGGIHSLAARMGQTLDETEITLRVYEAGVRSVYEEEVRDFSALAKELRAKLLDEKPGAVIDFIVNRNLEPKAVKHFGLGWDGVRIAFPYWDDEQCFAIKYRDRNGNKTSETGSKRGIYNLNEVRFKPYVILTEGESDTLGVWSHLTRMQLPATVAERIGVGGIPGASGSKSQWEVWALDLMWAKQVFIAYDADDAGDKGAEIPMAVLGDKAVRLRPRNGKDFTDHFLNGGTLIEYSQLGECFSVPLPSA